MKHNTILNALALTLLACVFAGAAAIIAWVWTEDEFYGRVLLTLLVTGGVSGWLLTIVQNSKRPRK